MNVTCSIQLFTRTMMEGEAVLVQVEYQLGCTVFTVMIIRFTLYRLDNVHPNQYLYILYSQYQQFCCPMLFSLSKKVIDEFLWMTLYTASCQVSYLDNWYLTIYHSIMCVAERTVSTFHVLTFTTNISGVITLYCACPHTTSLPYPTCLCPALDWNAGV